MITFDAAVIFNCEEIVAIVTGRGQGLLTNLKKSIHWDTLMEELGKDVDAYTNLDELRDDFKESNETNSIKLEIVYNVKTSRK